MKQFVEIKLKLSGSTKFKDMDKLLFHIKQSCDGLGYDIKEFNRAVISRFDENELISEEEMKL